MTGISHCINARELNVNYPARCRAYIASQPEVCPHKDCTGELNCREKCRRYANELAVRAKVWTVAVEAEKARRWAA